MPATPGGDGRRGVPCGREGNLLMLAQQVDLRGREAELAVGDGRGEGCRAGHWRCDAVDEFTFSAGLDSSGGGSLAGEKALREEEEGREA